MTLWVVSAVSKVRNLKAIHNHPFLSVLVTSVVSAVSKVRNLKAIHNSRAERTTSAVLFLPYQR